MFLSKKDSSKAKNILLQWIYQNILENQASQKIAKFIIVDSYEMDFIKGNVISVRVDKMYNILKSANYSLFYKR